MLNKNEIYDILKNDGAKLPRAVNFMSREELLEMYVERFGINPDAGAEQEKQENSMQQEQEQQGGVDVIIPLLEFAEDGWCTPLNKPYCKGLYRPQSADEYLALRKYASKEMPA